MAEQPLEDNFDIYIYLIFNILLFTWKRNIWYIEEDKICGDAYASSSSFPIGVAGIVL